MYKKELPKATTIEKCALFKTTRDGCSYMHQKHSFRTLSSTVPPKFLYLYQAALILRELCLKNIELGEIMQFMILSNAGRNFFSMRTGMMVNFVGDQGLPCS